MERGGVQARPAIAKVRGDATALRGRIELMVVGGDSDKAIRWLIALMVLCCDPLAIALTAAASARRLTTA
jgi:hypothetical protein